MHVTKELPDTDLKGRNTMCKMMEGQKVPFIHACKIRAAKSSESVESEPVTNRGNLLPGDVAHLCIQAKQRFFGVTYFD